VSETVSLSILHEKAVPTQLGQLEELSSVTGQPLSAKAAKIRFCQWEIIRKFTIIVVEKKETEGTGPHGVSD
jgi:hypothetical protein